MQSSLSSPHSVWAASKLYLHSAEQLCSDLGQLYISYRIKRPRKQSASLHSSSIWSYIPITIISYPLQMCRVQGLQHQAVVYIMHVVVKKKGREPFVRKTLPREGPHPPRTHKHWQRSVTSEKIWAMPPTKRGMRETKKWAKLKSEDKWRVPAVIKTTIRLLNKNNDWVAQRDRKGRTLSSKVFWNEQQ